MPTRRKHDRGKMKAAVYYSPRDIRVEDVPEPKIGSNEALVAMKACGICGSDQMDWYLKSRAPLILGHEPAGEVVETGGDVKAVSVGDRVFVHHHVACLTCNYCIQGNYTMCEQFGQTHIYPGGFVEKFKVPAPNLQIDTLRIPDNVSFEEAVLIEPIACCIRALRKCKFQPGDDAVIVGAGPSGVIIAMLLRFWGAGRIIVSDLVEYRLKAAKEFGADITINPIDENFVQKVREATDGLGMDRVIITAPNVEALTEGMKVCRKGGTVCVFAPTPPSEYIKVYPYSLFFSEINVIPSYSSSHIETRAALKLISSRKLRVKGLITHRFVLKHVKKAFETATKSKECLKVVLINE